MRWVTPKYGFLIWSKGWNGQPLATFSLSWVTDSHTPCLQHCPSQASQHVFAVNHGRLKTLKEPHQPKYLGHIEARTWRGEAQSLKAEHIQRPWNVTNSDTLATSAFFVLYLVASLWLEVCFVRVYSRSCFTSHLNEPCSQSSVVVYMYDTHKI